MCLIIINEKSKTINDSVLLTASIQNPHGLGVQWLDNYKIQYFASEQWQVLKTKRPYIAHFRFATVGEISRENCHPFEISNNINLFQNGTVTNLGNKKKTDTQHLAELLSETARKYWRNVLELTDCRYVITDTRRKKYVVYNRSLWHDKNGVLFSNSRNHAKDILAVYGTLKKGFGNHYCLNGATFVGSGKTANKYPMYANGVPHVIDDAGSGHKIDVELYIVPKHVLTRCDRLEGHPTTYERKSTKIDFNGMKINALLYFSNVRNFKDDNKMISNFERPNHTHNYSVNGLERRNNYNYWKPNYKPKKSFFVPKTRKPDFCQICYGSDMIYDEIEKKHFCMNCQQYNITF